MSLQFFAEPGEDPTASEPNTSTVSGLTDLLNTMNQPTEPELPVEPSEPPAPTEPPADPPEPSKDDKANYAFGAMRKQISDYEQLLTKVAQATGIEFSNPQELVNKLSDDALSKLAQKQNVPVELLQRMETLEQVNKQFESERLKQEAFTGFQAVASKYNLSQEELNAFAIQLDEAQMNPFEKQVDLIKEYTSRNADSIIQKAVQQAVQEALTRDSAANTHSSTPNQAQGNQGQSDDKISTIQGLNELLSQKPK